MAFTSEEVEFLLQIARDATAGRTFKERIDSLAEGLAALVPHSTISAFVVDPKGEGPGRHLIFVDRDPSILADYTAYYRFLDPMRVTFPEGKGRPYLMSDHVSSRHWGKDAFTSDYMSMIGVRYVMALGHRMPNGEMFALALHREKGLKDFSEHEREIVRLASPDIGRSIHGLLLNERVEELAVQPPTGMPRSGAIVFDSTGDIVHADASALALAERMGGGRGFPCDHFALELRRFFARPPGPGPAAMERVHPLDDGHWLRIRYSAISGVSRELVVAVFELLISGSPDHFDALTDLAGLSPREREVARLVIQGLGNRQIGAQLQMSTPTVGVHLSRIYKKTGADGRNELTAYLLGGPRPTRKPRV